ncbi:MAG: hypothetical protein H6Q00_2008 [Holophagaceae bacterium]|nr:hypothetical protein [Holophagaceae bacterium]
MQIRRLLNIVGKMTDPDLPQILPILMGSLRQLGAEGELVLEQNDGTRHLFWVGGELVYLHSDAAGEQFGNYLLRQGVLDFPALSELLANDEQGRLGEKVILWGLMTAQERDFHLLTLQGQVMVHALEHPIIRSRWVEKPVDAELSQDLKFRLNHRQFVWTTFQEANHLGDIEGVLDCETSWCWQAPPDLLSGLGDLPLTPQMAYALSFLGQDPISFPVFQSLGGLEKAEAARLLASLWALGALSLVKGEMPSVKRLAAPASMPQVGPTPSTPPPLPPTPTPFPELQLEPVSTEFPDLDIAQDPTEPTRIELDHPSEEGEAPALRARKLFLFARTLLQQERFGEALKALEQSLQLDPESELAFDPWLSLGKLRLANPAWSTRAIEAFQNAARLRPAAAEPWVQMGELYQRKGFKANAQACYRKALELDPSIPVPAGLDLFLGETDPGSNSILGRFKAIISRPEKRS